MNDYMIGTAAVGIVVVDGPGSAAFTDEEKLKIAVEVANGFDILYRLSKKSPVSPHLIFLAETRYVTLTLDPKTVPAPTGDKTKRTAEIKSIEPAWRDEALTKLGYSKGRAGVEAYRQSLLSKSWTAGTPQWAYVAFFTKYNTGWLAYESNRIWLVMQYTYLTSSTPWGLTAAGGPNLDHVFAHESGHIFGAPDEYSDSDCTTGGAFGSLKVPNTNCEVGNTSSVACLMKANTEDVCPSTLGHWGWVDANNDGKLDPLP